MWRDPVRGRLTAGPRREGGFRVAVRLARETRPDVVLLDIRMPELDGIAATRRITGDEDLAGVRVLILTTFEVGEYVFEALRAGASGFLGKGARPAALIDAIRTVARGDSLLSPAATRGLIAGPSSSSPTRPACAAGPSQRSVAAASAPVRIAGAPSRR